MCETRQSLHYFRLCEYKTSTLKICPTPSDPRGAVVKTPKNIEMFGSLGGGGEYGKHHVSHHVATPKLYDLGDANAHRYVPPWSHEEISRDSGLEQATPDIKSIKHNLFTINQVSSFHPAI